MNLQSVPSVNVLFDPDTKLSVDVVPVVSNRIRNVAHQLFNASSDVHRCKSLALWTLNDVFTEFCPGQRNWNADDKRN